MSDETEILARCDALAALTETPGMVTRTYLTAQHAQANQLVAGWMREAGMVVRFDAAGNVIGRLEGGAPGAKALLIGSHLDTVRNAGRYDGILGVVLAISVLAGLKDKALPFPVEVIGFGEEEGVRFGATLMGSRAIIGTFDPAWLDLRDEGGTSVADAFRAFGLDPARLPEAAMTADQAFAYLEVHIEQGPVLEAKNLPVGVVSAICGAQRRRYRVVGMAGHAGTVPMSLRRDALAAAAEMVLALEKIGHDHGVVATVGRLAVEPDAVNVIPGAVTFTLDLRAESDAIRAAALADADVRLAAVAQVRGVTMTSETFYEAPSVPCDLGLQAVLASSIATHGITVETLPSGAGHDAMAMASLAPVAMLFVRCAGGISHNPAEAVTGADVAVAAKVLRTAIQRLALSAT